MRTFGTPFNPATAIAYTVGQESLVEIGVFDICGRRVATLFHGSRQAGQYRTIWDGKDDTGQAVPAGVYFCHLAIGSFSSIKKMLLVK
ncbi:MAG: hypothetical protein KAY32_15915 [Candidatus Eisenbacteria sp.]|nr:hypothetical protein [Candidatus Eisenbacteria bacterium]